MESKFLKETSNQFPTGVLRIRSGPGGNCSSAGSAVDVLFLASVVMGLAAIAIDALLPMKNDSDVKEERVDSE